MSFKFKMCELRDVVKGKKGQGLVEYALILVLIAIVVVATLKSVGQTTCSVFYNVNTKLTNP